MLGREQGDSDLRVGKELQVLSFDLHLLVS